MPVEVCGLLGSCLPASMLRVASDPQGALEVAGLLRERVEAGWRPGEIRSALIAAGEGRVEAARRAVKVVEPPRTREQELAERAWEQVRREHPDVGRARQMSLAGELVEQWRREEVREVAS